MSKIILVTGGAGFIGSHMVVHLVNAYPSYRVINYDKLDYCSSLKLLSTVNNAANYNFVKGDILDADLVTHVLDEFKVDTVIHFAAQTHVDNSFGNSLSFSKNNILGTHTLLECCKQYGKLQCFIHVSTDEVYGESAYEMIGALELTALQPTNPYAATKAGAEHVVLSYFKSWSFPVILTRSNNIYGPYQYPEKVIPKWICLLEQGQPCPVHGDGSNRRSYLYIDDVIAAYDCILHRGTIGEVYNISSSNELSNLQLAEKLIKIYGKTDVQSWRVFVEDRAFNDKRYHIDGTKIRLLGWSPHMDFDQGLNKTIEWYRNTDLTKIWAPKTINAALQPHPIPSKF